MKALQFCLRYTVCSIPAGTLSRLQSTHLLLIQTFTGPLRESS